MISFAGRSGSQTNICLTKGDKKMPGSSAIELVVKKCDVNDDNQLFAWWFAPSPPSRSEAGKTTSTRRERNKGKRPTSRKGGKITTRVLLFHKEGARSRHTLRWEKGGG